MAIISLARQRKLHRAPPFFFPPRIRIRHEKAYAGLVPRSIQALPKTRLRVLKKRLCHAQPQQKALKLAMRRLSLKQALHNLPHVVTCGPYSSQQLQLGHLVAAHAFYATRHQYQGH
jgi:hypothetical protein